MLRGPCPALPRGYGHPCMLPRAVLATTYTLWQSLPSKGKERKILTMKQIKPSEIKDDDLRVQSFFFFSNSIPMLIFKPSDSIPFCQYLQ